MSTTEFAVRRGCQKPAHPGSEPLNMSLNVRWACLPFTLIDDQWRPAIRRNVSIGNWRALRGRNRPYRIECSIRLRRNVAGRIGNLALREVDNFEHVYARELMNVSLKSQDCCVKSHQEATAISAVHVTSRDEVESRCATGLKMGQHRSVCGPILFSCAVSMDRKNLAANPPQLNQLFRDSGSKYPLRICSFFLSCTTFSCGKGQGNDNSTRRGYGASPRRNVSPINVSIPPIARRDGQQDVNDKPYENVQRNECDGATVHA
ncbi:hypothetical protein SAMN02800692_1560 [Luteibacter sp. UNC138MFCol5.1]|nr:hypothetical protein SAMN02800692_1560 [Luteibacter sp. UNC138MFCol5.1]